MRVRRRIATATRRCGGITPRVSAGISIPQAACGQLLKELESPRWTHGVGENIQVAGPLSCVVHLLTFGCYGQWLPGDARGSVDRARGNDRGGAIGPSPALVSHSRHLLGEPGYVLSLENAGVVLGAIREVCTFRNWGLLAAHVRTTHVHAVVDVDTEPGDALRDFKSYASRALNRVEGARTRWSRGGSARGLAAPEAVRAAVRHVASGQGQEMALFVAERG